MSSTPLHRMLVAEYGMDRRLRAINDEESLVFRVHPTPLRRQVQDRLDGGLSRDIDEFVARHPALLDQIAHRQQQFRVWTETRPAFPCLLIV
jgi:hypothetical protein